MKALTIKQPWASLIMFGGKDIENRDWAAPAWLLGKRIAIHCSKKIDPFDIEDAMDLGYSRGLPLKCIDIIQGNLLGGVILGTVRLVTCVRSSESPWFVGDYGFVLADPQPFDEPIPARGSLGFWDWKEL
jgi:hypothetical protein